MNVRLKFDHSSDVIFIPDGYITDIKLTHLRFFDWLYDNPAYMTSDEKGHTMYRYDASAFLSYVNQVVLSSCREKAYLIPPTKQVNGKIVTLEF